MQLRFAQETPVSIRSVQALINPVSGSVGPGAVEQMSAIFADFGLDHRVAELEPGKCEAMVRAAVDHGPDLVVVLGGDGTARTVAQTCGPDGPLVAPLSGGTMNKLGRALYGVKPWPIALAGLLRRGVTRWVPGGEVAGHGFYCGAIIGSPALFAPAREAIRAREVGRAWRRAVLASRRAFRSELNYDLDGVLGEAMAISLVNPAVSRSRKQACNGLRAGVLEPPDPEAGATASVRLALSTLKGDWRDDPEITIPCVRGRAWGRTSLPVMLDGEFFRLGREVEFRMQPRAFRALALPPPTYSQGAGRSRASMAS